MYVHREFVPILQDFVPYWGCCTKTKDGSIFKFFTFEALILHSPFLLSSAAIYKIHVRRNLWAAAPEKQYPI